MVRCTRFIACLGLIALLSAPAVANVEIWLDFNHFEAASSSAPSGIAAGPRYFFDIHVVIDNVDIKNLDGSVTVTAPWGTGEWSTRILSDPESHDFYVEWDLPFDELWEVGFQQSHGSLPAFNAAIRGTWTVDISGVTGGDDSILFDVGLLMSDDWLPTPDITVPTGDAQTGPVPLVAWSDNGLSAPGSDAETLGIVFFHLASLATNGTGYGLPEDPKPWPINNVPSEAIPLGWNAVLVAYQRIGVNNIAPGSVQGSLIWGFDIVTFVGDMIFIDVICPCDCESPSDLSVGIVDFLALLAQWGGPSPCDCEGTPDGVVDIDDFLALLAAWGDCS